MNGTYAFRPHLEATGMERTAASLRTRVQHVKASDFSSDTAQTEGMQRFAAATGRSVGTEKIWMGETHVSPEALSDNHRREVNLDPDDSAEESR